MEQSFHHTQCYTVSLTSFRTGVIPDRQSPGWLPTSPGITGLSHQLPSGPVQYRTSNPHGGFPLVRGLTDYESLCSRLVGALSPGTPGMPISPTLAPTDTPRSHPTTSHIRLADTPKALSLHIHSQSRVHNMSGLSPYCCCTRLGFHRTAVLDVRAFTVLLFNS